jgi:hypothetical protein
MTKVKQQVVAVVALLRIAPNVEVSPDTLHYRDK